MWSMLRTFIAYFPFNFTWYRQRHCRPAEHGIDAVTSRGAAGRPASRSRWSFAIGEAGHEKGGGTVPVVSGHPEVDPHDQGFVCVRVLDQRRGYVQAGAESADA